MSYANAKILCGLVCAFMAIIPVSCTKGLTTNNIVYENDFEHGSLTNIQVGGWLNNGLFGAVPDLRIREFAGSHVLGSLNSNRVELKLNNLPLHQEVRVEFVLNIHNNWQNELWAMQFDGNYQLITGFSNDPAIKQSYPNWLNNGTTLSGAGANSQTTALPGICGYSNNPRGSSRYKIVNTYQHSDPTFTLVCNDAGGTFNDTCRRSWSIDDLKISILKN